MKVLDWIDKKYDIKDEYSSKIEYDLEFPIDSDVIAIIGGSGTGKTTLLKYWFKTDNVEFKVNSDKSIFELLVKEESQDEYERVSKLLFDVGLSSVPIWKNKYDTLSNGEKLRFEIAYKLNSDDSVIFIDEYTSMLDRQTAENLSRNLNRLLKQYDKKIVLVTAHYDILDWIEIDYLYDTTLKKYHSLQEKQVLTLMKWRYITQKETCGEYLASIII